MTRESGSFFWYMKTPGYAGEFKESLLAVMRKRKGILGFKFKMRSANCITNNQRNPHGKYKNSSTYKLELQVSYSLCTQIQAKRLLRRKKKRDRSNPTQTLRMEENYDSGGGSMSGPCSHVDRNTAKVFSVECGRLHKGEEQHTDV